MPVRVSATRKLWRDFHEIVSSIGEPSVTLYFDRDELVVVGISNDKTKAYKVVFRDIYFDSYSVPEKTGFYVLDLKEFSKALRELKEESLELATTEDGKELILRKPGATEGYVVGGVVEYSVIDLETDLQIEWANEIHVVPEVLREFLELAKHIPDAKITVELSEDCEPTIRLGHEEVSIEINRTFLGVTRCVGASVGTYPADFTLPEPLVKARDVTLRLKLPEGREVPLLVYCDTYRVVYKLAKAPMTDAYVSRPSYTDKYVDLAGASVDVFKYVMRLYDRLIISEVSLWVDEFGATLAAIAPGGMVYVKSRMGVERYDLPYTLLLDIRNPELLARACEFSYRYGTGARIAVDKREHIWVCGVMTGEVGRAEDVDRLEYKLAGMMHDFVSNAMALVAGKRVPPRIQGRPYAYVVVAVDKLARTVESVLKGRERRERSDVLLYLAAFPTGVPEYAVAEFDGVTWRTHDFEAVYTDVFTATAVPVVYLPVAPEYRYLRGELAVMAFSGGKLLLLWYPVKTGEILALVVTDERYVKWLEGKGWVRPLSEADVVSVIKDIPGLTVEELAEELLGRGILVGDLGSVLQTLEERKTVVSVDGRLYLREQLTPTEEVRLRIKGEVDSLYGSATVLRVRVADVAIRVRTAIGDYLDKFKSRMESARDLYKVGDYQRVLSYGSVLLHEVSTWIDEVSYLVEYRFEGELKDIRSELERLRGRERELSSRVARHNITPAMVGLDGVASLLGEVERDVAEIERILGEYAKLREQVEELRKIVEEAGRAAGLPTVEDIKTRLEELGRGVDSLYGEVRNLENDLRGVVEDRGTLTIDYERIEDSFKAGRYPEVLELYEKRRVAFERLYDRMTRGVAVAEPKLAEYRARFSSLSKELDAIVEQLRRLGLRPEDVNATAVRERILEISNYLGRIAEVVQDLKRDAEEWRGRLERLADMARRASEAVRGRPSTTEELAERVRLLIARVESGLAGLQEVASEVMGYISAHESLSEARRADLRDLFDRRMYEVAVAKGEELLREIEEFRPKEREFLDRASGYLTRFEKLLAEYRGILDELREDAERLGVKPEDVHLHTAEGEVRRFARGVEELREKVGGLRKLSGTWDTVVQEVRRLVEDARLLATPTPDRSATLEKLKKLRERLAESADAIRRLRDEFATAVRSYAELWGRVKERLGKALEETTRLLREGRYADVVSVGRRILEELGADREELERLHSRSRESGGRVLHECQMFRLYAKVAEELMNAFGIKPEEVGLKELLEQVPAIESEVYELGRKVPSYAEFWTEYTHLADTVKSAEEALAKAPKPPPEAEELRRRVEEVKPRVEGLAKRVGELYALADSLAKQVGSAEAEADSVLKDFTEGRYRDVVAKTEATSKLVEDTAAKVGRSLEELGQRLTEVRRELEELSGVVSDLRSRAERVGVKPEDVDIAVLENYISRARTQLDSLPKVDVETLKRKVGRLREVLEESRKRVEKTIPREPPEKPPDVAFWERYIGAEVVGWVMDTPPGFRYKVWVLWVRDEGTGEIVKVVTGIPSDHFNLYRAVTITGKYGARRTLLSPIEEAERVAVRLPPHPEVSETVSESGRAVTRILPEDVRRAVEEVRRMLAERPFSWGDFRRDVLYYLNAVASWERTVEARDAVSLYSYLVVFRNKFSAWVESLGRVVPELHERYEAVRVRRPVAPALSREEIERLWTIWSEILRKNDVDPEKYREVFEDCVAVARSFAEAAKILELEARDIVAEERLRRRDFDVGKPKPEPKYRLNWKDVARGIAYVKVRLMSLAAATEARDAISAYRILREILDTTEVLIQMLLTLPDVRKFKDMTGL